MRGSILVGLVLVAACESPGDAPAAGPTVRMDFARRSRFFAAPFPSDDVSCTTIDHSRRPIPAHQRYVQGLIDLAARSRGFATSATVYLSLTNESSALQLPSPAASVRPDA